MRRRCYMYSLFSETPKISSKRIERKHSWGATPISFLWRSGSAPFLYGSSDSYGLSSGYADAVGSNPTRNMRSFLASQRRSFCGGRGPGAWERIWVADRVLRTHTVVSLACDYVVVAQGTSIDTHERQVARLSSILFDGYAGVGNPQSRNEHCAITPGIPMGTTSKQRPLIR